SATEGAARPAFRVQQLRPAYAGPAALVDALNGGNAPALALAGADFDADGASDLVVGYSWHGAGIVSLQRGNPDALAPNGQAAFPRMQRGYDPAWLAPNARVVSVPEPVSYAEAGDFNGDGRPDVL